MSFSFGSTRLLVADLADHRALLGTLVFGILAITMPHEKPPSSDEKMDWFGPGLGVSALIAFSFVWKYVISIPVLPFVTADLV